MTTEEKISGILQDLYSLAPELKIQESEIRQIISKLLLAKPDFKIDEQFALELKSKLLAKASQKKEGKKPVLRNIFGIFGPNKSFGYSAAAFVLVALIIAGSFYAGQKQESKKLTSNNSGNGQNTSQNPSGTAAIGSQEQQKALSQIKKFASKEEFLAYLENAQPLGYGRGGGSPDSQAMLAAPVGMGESAQNNVATKSAGTAPSSAGASGRVSETNVQVLGIDEPDIVKTDGKSIFVSNNQPILYMGMGGSMGIAEKIMPPYQNQQNTEIISATPPQDIKKIGKIDKQGDMLLYKSTLIIFSNEFVYGYNVQDPANPKEVWKVKYENNGYLNTARLYNGVLYLVVGNYPDFNNPCPIRPLSVNDKAIEIPCTEIYHPIAPVSDIATYHAFALNPETGEVKNKLSFVGSSGQAVVYMSQGSLYITYTYMEDQVKILADFIKTKAGDVIPSAVLAKIDKLQSYDISSSAKMVEFSQILEKYYNGISSDDRVKIENELTNRMSDYLKSHQRSLQFTGIVKIPLNQFEVVATGSVPGTPLNQFSIDEYQGNLRIATTVGNAGIGYWGGWSSDNSANDVYVLDGNLTTVGSVQDLGKGERIYSARFIEDKGYLVTFKQVDPFYVLDLSNPKKPVMKGELKIPGYSSYLHPLAQNRILGVGQENGKVKVSLFDVSDPSNPKELDKYNLDEYWTDVSSTHHAFLQDKDHNIFFLPGGNNGYIFSYKNDKLSMEKAVSNVQARRALYINNYLYVVGTDKIVVVDENNWNRVGELQL